MREIRGSAALVVQPRVGICSVEDCFGTTYDDDVCPRCREEIDALDAMARERRERFRAGARVPGERLRNIAWFVLFVALMNAIGYYVWPYIWLIFQLWFGQLWFGQLWFGQLWFGGDR